MTYQPGVYVPLRALFVVVTPNYEVQEIFHVKLECSEALYPGLVKSWQSIPCPGIPSWGLGECGNKNDLVHNQDYNISLQPGRLDREACTESKAE